MAALSQATRRSYAAAIRQLRTEAALTQAELAERSGCSRHTVYSVESGQRSASPWTLACLVAALDVSYGDFLVHVLWHASNLNERRQMAEAPVERAARATSQPDTPRRPTR